MAGSLLMKLDMKRRGVLYIQIWENNIKVTNVATDEVFDELTTVSYQCAANGKMVNIKCGNNALVNSGPETKTMNPFSHPRTLLANTTVIHRFFKYLFKKYKKSFIYSPIVVIHLMEKVEGDLLDMEKYTLNFVGTKAGASSIFPYVGDKFTIPLFKRIYTRQVSRDELMKIEQGV